jgi:hypothetical protein
MSSGFGVLTVKIPSDGDRIAKRAHAIYHDFVDLYNRAAERWPSFQDVEELVQAHDDVPEEKIAKPDLNQALALFWLLSMQKATEFDDRDSEIERLKSELAIKEMEMEGLRKTLTEQ